MKENTDDRKVLLQVDYAENFTMDQQDAIQSAHWKHKYVVSFHGTRMVWSSKN